MTRLPETSTAPDQLLSGNRPQVGALPDKPDLSVVLPVRDEQQSLRELDRELRETLAELDESCEILYIDDHSSDGSAEILRELVDNARGGGIRTRSIRLRSHSGQTAALAAGFDLSAGSTIVSLDADGQNNPRDIPRLLLKLSEGFDLASGWRRDRQDALLSRRIPSILANWLVSRITGVPLHDTGCTLKAYRSSALKEVRLYGEMHRFAPALAAYRGARVGEIRVDHRPRFGGESKYGGERVLKVLVDLVHIRFVRRYYDRPMHFFGGVAVLFFWAFLMTVLAMVFFKFGWLATLGVDYRASFVETPLPALAGTLFLGTVTSLFFGLMAEILIRIHHESSGFKAYSVQEELDSHA